LGQTIGGVLFKSAIDPKAESGMDSRGDAAGDGQARRWPKAGEWQADVEARSVRRGDPRREVNRSKYRGPPLVHRFVALVGGILALPIGLLTALLIKLDSRGPVFYRQERVGNNGKTFVLLKFRSMRVDAEQAGPVWASKDDDRTTRVGRIIRKVRIDEIPQFWNILRGEMAFVGPRPERPHFVAQLAQEIPYYEQRHLIPPGLTGWAQIKYPYGASIEDARQKLQYDLFYVKNQSLMLDAIVLFETIKIIIFGRGGQ